MNEELSTIKTEKPTYHLSLGSAATGIHVSIDIEVDDPLLYDKTDKFIEYWTKTSIAVSNIRNTLKGG